MFTKKTLFNASFEESLNLLDDSISGTFIIENYSSAQEKEKFRGTIKSYVWLVILTVIFVFGPNWLLIKANSYLIPYIKDYFQIANVHNFLPEWIFWLFTLMWLFVVLVLKVFNQSYLFNLQRTISFICYIFSVVNIRDESIVLDYIF